MNYMRSVASPPGGEVRSACGTGWGEPTTNILLRDVSHSRISPRNLRLRCSPSSCGRDQAHQPAPPSHIARDRSQAPFETHRNNKRPAAGVRAPVHPDGGVGHGASPADDPALRHRDHEGPAFAGCANIAFEAGRCGWSRRRSEPIRRSVLDQPGDRTGHHRRARTDSNDVPHHVVDGRPIALAGGSSSPNKRSAAAAPDNVGGYGRAGTRASAAPGLSTGPTSTSSHPRAALKEVSPALSKAAYVSQDASHAASVSFQVAPSLNRPRDLASGHGAID